jgi:hypothetical protein
MTLAVLSVIFVFSLLPAALAHPQAAVGKVVAVRGSITARDLSGVNRRLTLKSPVFLNDTIQTGKGRVQLMFKDNTLITLGRKTQFTITAYAWQPGDKQSKMETRVSEGTFRVMGGAITRTAPENFKTHTPSGNIGIRGSMFAGRFENNELFVLFQGGTGIFVQNSMGMVNITRPGFGTRVLSAAHPPEPPARMSQQELDQLEQQLAAPVSEESGNDEPATASSSAEDTALAESEPIPADSDTIQTTSTETDSPVSHITSIASDAVLTSNQTELTTTIQSGESNPAIEQLLTSLGYSGSLFKPASLPSTGIWGYFGALKNTLTDESDQSIKFIVNWHNRRIIGFDAFSDDEMHHDSGFGFGSITSTGDITNFNIFGSDANSGNAVRALGGSETFGQFYGADASGIGLAMEGYDVEIQNHANQFFWSEIAAATFEDQAGEPSTGTHVWQGFFVGVAEDMTAPDSNRRVFHNTSAGKSDFSLTIDKDAGTFTGAMTGEDFNDTGNTINGMAIGGGAGDSVYIDDQILAATFSGDNVITIETETTGLKPKGNYMVASKETALSDYTTWGYWEAAYPDPVSSNTYHIHVPGSLWIAGEPTPSSTISGLINSRFSGTYTGNAQGVMVDGHNQISPLTNGFTNLVIDFNAAASTPVSGNIVFDQVDLPVTSTTGNLTHTGFIGTISSAAASTVAGTYYGPDAKSIGGNFSAQMTSGIQYHGIFGGNR